MPEKIRRNVHAFQPRQIRPSEAFETCIPFADTFLPPDNVQNFMERTRPDVPFTVVIEPLADVINKIPLIN
jgi:hypothetical protein